MYNKNKNGHHPTPEKRNDYYNKEIYNAKTPTGTSI